MKPILDLSGLMVDQLRELFDAEIELVKFLEKLWLEATIHHLVKLITQYQKTTDDNHWMLQQVFNDLVVASATTQNQLGRPPGLAF